VPVVSAASGPVIMQTTMALLFIVGTCFGVVRAIPILTAANAAVDNIARLEASVREAATAARLQVAPPQRFGTIEVRNAEFQYVDQISGAGFHIGPMNFTLRSGDLVFIMGGNGSGKSTFLRLLAGLYSANAGEIVLDGQRVGDANRDFYRGLMSAIFVDYHLFHHLYGIHDPDAAEVDRLLREFLLHDKTHLADGEFQTLNLSSGQRKRLALIVSLLEKRPILLLDEWAADQDPEFRTKFYHELLPALNRAGVTLVVVTHDSRYIDELEIPARKLRMDEGRFVTANSVEIER
jgi:putative ATP-binding cassette transporter